MAKRNVRKNNNRRPKEVEVNVDRDDINAEEMRGPRKRGGRRGDSTDNDASWYAKNAELLAAAANFPFGYPIGVPVPKTASLGKSTVKENPTIPGIMVIPFLPTVGKSESGQSPVNLAAKLQYSNIRYANSGTTYGDPSDLMMYYLAIDSLYMFHQMCVRAYGVLRTYNYMNKYYPQAIIEAMGLDFDDLNANITQFWGFINTLAVKLQSFAVPGDMAIFVRHSWMASSIYLDANNAKAQSYMYLPTGYYQWSEQQTGPNSLKMLSPYTPEVGQFSLPNAYKGKVALSSIAKLKLEDLREFASKLINPILESESFGLTTGAILKSYGADNLMKVGQIPEDYQVIPVYNAEVLSQIENATVFQGVDMPSTLVSFNITQNTGVDDMYIIAKPKLISGSCQINATTGKPDNDGIFAFLTSVNPGTNITVNMHMDKPTPADFMVATRLTSTALPPQCVNNTGSSSYSYTAELENFGSEVAMNPYIVVYTYNPNANTAYMQALPMTNLVMGSSQGLTTDYSNWKDYAKALAYAQQFDWHPILSVILLDNPTAAQIATKGSEAVLAYNWCTDTRDIDNFAIVTDDNLELLNQCAMLSLFDSPRVAQLVARPYKR